MNTLTPRFDNLQNELRRELNPQGFLEEEVFQSVVTAAASRRWETGTVRYRHDRAFFLALREFRNLQALRTERPRPVPPSVARSAKVIMFPSAAKPQAA